MDKYIKSETDINQPNIIGTVRQTTPFQAAAGSLRIYGVIFVTNDTLGCSVYWMEQEET